MQFVTDNKRYCFTAVNKAETESDIAFAVNATGPENLAIAAKMVSARLLHVSTDYVFDSTSSTPYLPDSATSHWESMAQANWKVKSVSPMCWAKTVWSCVRRGFIHSMAAISSRRC